HLLGFDSQDQIRIATAVSEIARNALQYGGGGRVEFSLTGRDRRALQISVQDPGPGITDLQGGLDGRIVAEEGTGWGIMGARRLMDKFEIQSNATQGTKVVLEKELSQPVDKLLSKLPEIAGKIANQATGDPFDEIQRQNQELVHALDQLRLRQA